ncbi:hypothetical protein [Streptosporangium sp. 'caverna']|uniref:hypothetical protein n=1 Tax=Streptosporangium sp. 'caverna' TaxID=2202249 RepID=UPI000D7DEFF0|nr:hypothetical protein [Streptosporangium sp. 'caverna']AWS45853.1 hypothetical protein DKM19_35740 [Streptosporangium sp. 'caverna']
MSDKQRPEDASPHGEEGEKEHHGYSPDVGRASEEVIQSGNRAFAPPPETKGPGRVVSEEEREGVSPTDTEAASPLGVGTGTGRRAEEIAEEEDEEGREAAGVDEKTGRPYGVSTSEDSTGVKPRDPGR